MRAEQGHVRSRTNVLVDVGQPELIGNSLPGRDRIASEFESSEDPSRISTRNNPKRNSA